MAEQKDAFLSFSTPDLAKARRLYSDLTQLGLDVWFSDKHLKPGPWQPQIKRAITRCRHFVLCLSNAAIDNIDNEVGYQFEELHFAFDIATNVPVTKFSIVPVRFEECSRGDLRIESNQQYDLFPDWGKEVNNLAVRLRGGALPEDKTPLEQLRITLEARADAAYFGADRAVAEGIYTSLLVIFGDTIEYLSRRVICRLEDYNHTREEHRLREAEEDISRLEKLTCVTARDHSLVARAYQTVADCTKSNDFYRKALDCADRAIELDRTYGWALLEKGYIHRMLKNYEEAARFYSAGVEFYQNDASSFYMLGWILVKLERFDEAVVHLTRVIEIQANHKCAYRYRAEAWHKLGENERALSDYESALELDPYLREASRGRDEVLRSIESS